MRFIINQFYKVSLISKYIQKMFSKKVLQTVTSINARPSILNIIRNETVLAKEAPPRVEKSINSVQLLGRVGGDPVLKGTDEHPVVVFSVATHSNYKKNSGEFSQRTEWHRVICFKPTLRDSLLQFLKKGQRVYITGRVTYGEIKNEDGKTQSSTSVLADDVIFFQGNATK